MVVLVGDAVFALFAGQVEYPVDLGLLNVLLPLHVQSLEHLLVDAVETVGLLLPHRTQSQQSVLLGLQVLGQNVGVACLLLVVVFRLHV